MTDPELGLDRRRIEERQITVCRRGREDLDVSGLREIGERTDEVATEARSVRVPQATVGTDVEVGELGPSLIGRIGEASNVPLRADDLIVDVLERADVDVAIGQLLDEDGREPNDHPVRDARVSKIVQEDEQGQIRAEHRLVDPLLAVRPAPGAAAVRKM